MFGVKFAKSFAAQVGRDCANQPYLYPVTVKKRLAWRFPWKLRIDKI